MRSPLELELLLGCDPRRLGQGAISREVTKDSGRRSRASHETLVEIGNILQLLDTCLEEGKILNQGFKRLLSVKHDEHDPKSACSEWELTPAADKPSSARRNQPNKPMLCPLAPSLQWWEEEE